MRIFFFTIFALLWVSSCQCNRKVPKQRLAELQGTWKQQALPYQEQLLNKTIHTFTFTCDSFYLILQTSAKANIYPDSCFRKGQWTEYVKGKYVVKNDTLYLNGTFTSSNFKQKISGCYRIGQYVPVFIIKNKDTHHLLLQDLFQHLPLSLESTHKTHCDPFH